MYYIKSPIRQQAGALVGYLCESSSGAVRRPPTLFLAFLFPTSGAPFQLAPLLIVISMIFLMFENDVNHLLAPRNFCPPWALIYLFLFKNNRIN